MPIKAVALERYHCAQHGSRRLMGTQSGLHRIYVTTDPAKIVLPGASKEALKNLPEFQYHA